MISAARIHNFRVEVWKTIEVICDRLKAMGFDVAMALLECRKGGLSLWEVER
jgi:hypothetical protein